jgi:D-alanyl-D-alanine carboxypeptidase (penicillin-binding protein 5/6)
MPLTREQIYRRRRISVFGGLAVVLVTGFYLPFSLLQPLPSAQPVVDEPRFLDTEVPVVGLPTYGASAVGAVGYPGVLAQQGSTAALPMASITKLITALVVLEAHPLATGETGPSVTMTQDDVAWYGHYLAQNGKVAGVRPGSVFTERQLLDLVLIDSANNYTMSLVQWAFGSEEAYRAAARAWLDANGLPGIVVTEPTGIDPANVATAADLVELGRVALTHPVVAEIVGTRSAEVPDLGAISNTNKLLGSDGVTGIKTGTLDDFGANLLFSAEYPVGSSTVTVVGVVLGGPNHDVLDVDIPALLADVLAGFTEVPLVVEGEPVASYRTAWDTTAEAVAAETASVVVWGGTPVAAEVTVNEVGTAESGADVGEVVFTAGDRTVTVELELSATLTDPGPWWRITHPFG